MKNLFKEYYKYRLHKLVEAQQNYTRYWALRTQGNSIICAAIDFQIAWQEFLLECYRSLIPKSWICK